MRENIDAATITALGQEATKPRYLVELGFDSPVLLATYETVLWGNATFLAADLTVKGGSTPALSIFNEGAAVGALVLSEGAAGRSVKIWEIYGTETAVAGAPSGYGTPVLVFSGEMSKALVGDKIQIQCKQSAPLKTPRVIVSAPTFNHLPKAGARIHMHSQVFILE